MSALIQKAVVIYAFQTASRFLADPNGTNATVEKLDKNLIAQSV
jgi:hypothetical protein